MSLPHPHARILLSTPDNTWKHREFIVYVDLPNLHSEMAPVGLFHVKHALHD